jgi:hypothetical protein
MHSISNVRRHQFGLRARSLSESSDSYLSDWSSSRSYEIIPSRTGPTKIPFFKRLRFWKREPPLKSRERRRHLTDSDSDSSSYLSSESDESAVYDERLEPLRDLFKRPFWRGVWIIQEISKSRNVKLLCGHQMLDWYAFESLFDSLEEIPREVVALREFRKNERSGFKLSLIAALDKSRYFESSDASDKIYGHLGLTSDGADVVPMPNYIHAPGVVFFQVFEELVSRMPDLSYLVLEPAQSENLTAETSSIWMNYEEGVPGWIFSMLKAKSGSVFLWETYKLNGSTSRSWPSKHLRGYRSLIRDEKWAEASVNISTPFIHS